MNNERFLEAINRLSFTHSIEAVQTFARSSHEREQEEVLLQICVILYFAERQKNAELNFENFVLGHFLTGVLNQLEWRQKLMSQMSYKSFLSSYIAKTYELYRTHRVETLLKYTPYTSRVDGEEIYLPTWLSQSEAQHVKQIQQSITGDFFKNIFSIIHNRYKHQFFAKHFWVLLMWLSLGTVLAVSLALSSKGSLVNLVSSIQGWFAFLRGDY